MANAFSSLYSQVSGTPLQKIGSMNSTASIKEAASPPPLNRSNTASRLMKTLSKLNLCGNQQAGETGSCSTPSPVEKGPSEDGQLEDADAKNEPKTPKHFKTSLLATVKEEAPSSQPSIVGVLQASELPSGDNVAQGMREGGTSCKDEQNSVSLGHPGSHDEQAVVTDSSGLEGEVPDSTTCGLEGSSELPIFLMSLPEKEPCAPIANPSIVSLMSQQKDSFEMEEVSEARCSAHILHGFACQHWKWSFSPKRLEFKALFSNIGDLYFCNGQWLRTINLT